MPGTRPVEASVGAALDATARCRRGAYGDRERALSESRIAIGIQRRGGSRVGLFRFAGMEMRTYARGSGDDGEEDVSGFWMLGGDDIVLFWEI